MKSHGLEGKVMLVSGTFIIQEGNACIPFIGTIALQQTSCFVSKMDNVSSKLHYVFFNSDQKRVVSHFI